MISFLYLSRSVVNTVAEVHWIELGCSYSSNPPLMFLWSGIAICAAPHDTSVWSERKSLKGQGIKVKVFKKALLPGHVCQSFCFYRNKAGLRSSCKVYCMAFSAELGNSYRIVHNLGFILFDWIAFTRFYLSPSVLRVSLKNTHTQDKEFLLNKGDWVFIN